MELTAADFRLQAAWLWEPREGLEELMKPRL